MITIDNVGFSFGAKPVLQGIDAILQPGELVGIIGPSGAGKTTLLRILLGELVPTVGHVSNSSGRPLSVGYVPQLDSGERSFPITVEEMVLLGGAAASRRRPWFDQSEKAAATKILKRLEILKFANNRLSELSGGQFQRALIARALMSNPSLLLLDEPTSGIDLHTRQQVLEIVYELRADGITVVLSTHDLNWVAAHLPRIICLNKVVTGDGNPRMVLTPEVVMKTYGAKMDVILHNGRPVIVDHLDVGTPS